MAKSFSRVFFRLVFVSRLAAAWNVFDVKVAKTDTGAARIDWSKIEAHRDWTTLSAGWKLAERNTVGSKRIKVQGDTEG